GRSVADALAGACPGALPGAVVSLPPPERNPAPLPRASRVDGGGGPGAGGEAGGDGVRDREAVVETLRSLYATALGYPPEVLTEDADLEADLGVDSIKQTELFAQAAARYGRTLPAEGSRLTSYTTLDALAGLLATLPAQDAGARGAGTPEVSA
ncbi:acyl carrier protein, partial [Streptomyces hydrogenans]